MTAAFDYELEDEVDTDFVETPNGEPSTEPFEYDEPDATVGTKGRRAAGALKYEKKVNNLFSSLFRVAVNHPAGVSDGAAIMMHGPTIAEKAGDLAAHDKRFARAIDMITDGAENPYANLVVAAAPLILQIMRNHESDAQPSVRAWRIPFTKKVIHLKLKIKLPSGVRNLTNDPENLNHHVFTNKEVRDMIEREGINLAWKPSGNRKK